MTLPFASHDFAALRRAVACSALALLLATVAAQAPCAAADDSGLDDLVALIAQVDDADFQLDLLRGIRDGLKGRKSVPTPKGWDAVYAKLAASEKPEVREQARLLALVFGDERALGQLRTSLVDSSIGADQRLAALEGLAARRDPALPPLLHQLLTDQAMCGAALRALAAYAVDDTPQVILKHYPQMSTADKLDAVATLASRPAYALALVEAMERGHVPRGDVNAFTARQIRSFPDESLRRRLIAAWGEIRESNEDQQALIRQYKAKLA
ncbi:MAG: hypothetical protein KDA41_03025, partial [Planctomycetales bacterium]|nr:hypothetical protein [Planctomycetales bacterium]